MHRDQAGRSMKRGKTLASRISQRGQTYVTASIAAIAVVGLLLAPAGASAASPVLEFVAPGHSWPVSFTTESGPVAAEMAGSELTLECAESHGEGEITGPRSVVAEYQFTKCHAQEPGEPEHKCKSSDVEEEIATGPIAADLVFIDQAKGEVGMLLNPNGGPGQPYISFKCGGVEAAGFGPFLAPGSPVNQATETFTMTLRRSGSTQTITKYEGEKGEELEAVPTGEKGKSGNPVETSVEMTVTVRTSSPVEVRAISAAAVEAKQHEEEAAAAAKKKQEEEAAAKKRQEEEAAAKKKQDEEAKKKREEEKAKEREATEKRHKSKGPTRAQRLSRALKVCKRQPKHQRARCIAHAHKRYGPAKKGKGGKSPKGVALTTWASLPNASWPERRQDR